MIENGDPLGSEPEDDDIEIQEFDLDDEFDLEDLLEDEGHSLTLRDYFAGVALRGVLDAVENELTEDSAVREHALKWARSSYAIADAMLIVRDELDFQEFEDEA